MEEWDNAPAHAGHLDLGSGSSVDDDATAALLAAGASPAAVSSPVVAAHAGMQVVTRSLEPEPEQEPEQGLGIIGTAGADRREGGGNA